MARIRMSGLILLITVIMIGMASVATQTSHIRFKQPDRSAGAQEPGESPQVQFVSVPIIYPLAAVGGLAMVLWFVPAGLQTGPSTNRPRRQRSNRVRRKPARRSLGSRFVRR